MQVLGALFVARQFGPELFGFFSFFVSLAQTVSLFVDFGLMATMVRLAGRKQNLKAKQFIIQATFVLQLLLYACFCLGLYAFKSTLLNAAEVPQQYHVMYDLALLTASVLWLQLLLKSAMQVFNSLASIGVFTLTYALARIVFTVLAWRYLESDILSFYLALYLWPLLFSLLVFCVYFGFKLRSKIVFNLDVSAYARDLRELLHYGRWMVGQPFYSFMFLLPMLLLTTKSACEMGIYSAAYTFASVFTLLNTTLRQINLPKASVFSTQAEVDVYLANIWKLGPLYLLGVLAGIVALSGLMTWGLGPEYAQSVPAFCVLGVGMAIMVFVGQANIVAHVHNRPDYFLKLTMLEMLILLPLSYVVIFVMGAGALGAAAALAFVIASGEVLLYLRVRLLLLASSGITPIEE